MAVNEGVQSLAEQIIRPKQKHRHRGQHPNSHRIVRPDHVKDAMQEEHTSQRRSMSVYADVLFSQYASYLGSIHPGLPGPVAGGCTKESIFLAGSALGGSSSAMLNCTARRMGFIVTARSPAAPLNPCAVPSRHAAIKTE